MRLDAGSLSFVLRGLIGMQQTDYRFRKLDTGSI